MRWWRVVLAGAAISLVVACGSDGDDRSLSRAEFIEAGDRLCRGFMDETEALGQPTSLAEMTTFLDDAISIAERTYAAFLTLEPPSDGEAVHDALLRSLSQSTDQIRRARDAVAAGDEQTFTAAVDEAVRIGRSSDEDAKAYGFAVCGSEEELRDG